eukprot:g2575.t1
MVAFNLAACVTSTALFTKKKKIFYGLTLVTNGPATFGLVEIEAATGNESVVGPAHKELFGCSDLVAIAHGVLYYLGDTMDGATLVGINVTDGSKACSRVIPLEEIGFVGLGQTLDYDLRTDSLVLSGITQTAKNTTEHSVFRSPASTNCGPFEHVGTYGDAEYAPMLHSSTLDAIGQRLFVFLAHDKTTQAVGIVDLTFKTNMTVIVEGTPDLDDTLIGMHWDDKTGTLYGIIADDEEGLVLHSLRVEDGAWNSPRQIEGVPSDWNAVYGNEATASTFEESERMLYFLAGVQDEQGNIVSQDLAGVHVDNAKLSYHATLSKVGLGGSGLMALAMNGNV